LPNRLKKTDFRSDKFKSNAPVLRNQWPTFKTVDSPSGNQRFTPEECATIFEMESTPEVKPCSGNTFEPAQKMLSDVEPSVAQRSLRDHL